MRTTQRLGDVYGNPVAIMGPDGEWVEVGYVTDLEFSVDQDDTMEWEKPFRVRRRHSMSLDVNANESALSTLLAIARGPYGAG